MDWRFTTAMMFILLVLVCALPFWVASGSLIDEHANGRRLWIQAYDARKLRCYSGPGYRRLVSFALWPTPIVFSVNEDRPFNLSLHAYHKRTEPTPVKSSGY